VQKIFLIVAFIPLVAASATQAATASEHRHARANDHAVLSEQVRNSNAYAALDGITVRAANRDDDEGAMTSGIAGH
jgi:hypothetical protein